MNPLHSDTVLIVQADADSREMYAAYLHHRGFRPLAASSAQRALRLASRADIIVTGLHLPGAMDGISLIERLKADSRTRHIPVIVVTSCAWVADRDRAERAGCDLFLSKPCLPDDLERGMRHLLASSVVNEAAAPAH